MGDSSLSAIVPAYNEEHSLESSVLKTKQSFKSLDIDYEIIIVNDCSSDRTGDIAEAMAQQEPEVSCRHHEINQGIGNAFKTGIRDATKDYVVFVPVDSPLDSDDIKTYLPRIDLCDIIVGVRVERVGYTHIARFLSFFYNRILVPLLFNVGIQDVNWIQVYRRQLFVDGIIKYNSRSLFWLVEILIHAKEARLIVAEVPAKMKKRIYGKPTSMRLSVIFQTLYDMLSVFVKRRSTRRMIE